MASSSSKTTLSFKRYPATTNRSLQPWSAADDHILQTARENGVTGKTIAIYNDAFGYLSCHLHSSKPVIFVERKSQEKSIQNNLKTNNLAENQVQLHSSLDELPNPVDMAIINIPKSMELFRFYLSTLSAVLKDEGIVICGFMTKYFTPQMLTIAEEFFGDVHQSMAWKKSRVLVLKGKKPVEQESALITLSTDFGEIKQYPGVFSGDHIDYATQFLLQNLELLESEKTIADVGSGNGVIASFIQQKNPDAQLHLIDDSILAIESSKLNLKPENATFHWDDTLSSIEANALDLAVSNPPFHFGYETNIEVSVKLFKQIALCLKPGGRFLCVSNKHLNYKTHLEKLFSSVHVIAENDKYEVYGSVK
jgi:23S rRNA (guanine1835-N2)-methyltransferase